MPEKEQPKIDLWSLDLSTAAPNFSRLVDYCSGQELEKANTLKSETLRRRYLTCRGRVREILAGYAGLAPSALQFSTSKCGKPYLTNFVDHLKFNISHSGDLGVIAISPEFEIGVDIEIQRYVEPLVAELHFSAVEITALKNLSEESWLDGFYRCWTRKEAFVKALGTGLLRPLDSFTVPLAEDNTRPMPLVAVDGEASSDLAWRFLPFRLGDRAVGAVCVASGEQAVTLRCF